MIGDSFLLLMVTSRIMNDVSTVGKGVDDG